MPHAPHGRRFAASPCEAQEGVGFGVPKDHGAHAAAEAVLQPGPQRGLLRNQVQQDVDHTEPSTQGPRAPNVGLGHPISHGTRPHTMFFCLFFLYSVRGKPEPSTQGPHAIFAWARGTPEILKDGHKAIIGYVSKNTWSSSGSLGLLPRNLFQTSEYAVSNLIL